MKLFKHKSGVIEKYGDLEKKYLGEVIDSGKLFYSNGDKTKKLQKVIQDHYNVKYASMTSSGTAALHCAIASLEMLPGSEVITTPITDMGSVIGILYQNLIPVFADIDPHTYNITAESIRKVITDHTKAVIVVHLGGNPAAMGPIMDLAREKNLMIIEDCAQAYEAAYKGKNVGTIGDLGCFSLNDYKHIGCGEGGYVITNNEELHHLAFNFADKNYNRTHAGTRLGRLAPNYRITELQSAVALAQFTRLHDIVEHAHQMGDLFIKGIQGLDGIDPPKVSPDDYCSYWFTMLRVDPKKLGISREKLVALLNLRLVLISVGYIPVPLYMEPLFMNKQFFPGNIWPAEIIAKRTISYKPGLCPIAEEVLQTAMRMSIDLSLTEEKMTKIISAFHAVYRHLK